MTSLDLAVELNAMNCKTVPCFLVSARVLHADARVLLHEIYKICQTKFHQARRDVHTPEPIMSA